MKRKKNEKAMATRSFTAEVRAEKVEGKGSRIIGRPIVFESETILSDMWGDQYKEVIHKGALDDADLKDVRFMVNHDMNALPLARSRNNNEKSTMKLNVDDDGMEIVVDLDTENNTEARNLYSAVERGDISGMSFGFFITKRSWEDGQDGELPTLHIDKIGSVLEVSAVSFPAYESTEISVRDIKPSLESGVEIEGSLESGPASLESGEKRESLESDLEEEKLKYEKMYYTRR